jgi:hypothetical protein
VRGDLLSSLEEASVVFERLVSDESTNVKLPRGWTSRACEGGATFCEKILDRYGPPCTVSIARLDEFDGFAASIVVKPTERYGEYGGNVYEYAESFFTSSRVVEFSARGPGGRRGDVDRAIAASSVAWMFPDEVRARSR